MESPDLSTPRCVKFSMILWNSYKIPLATGQPKLALFRAFAYRVSIYIFAALLLGGSGAAHDDLPRNALWVVVHNMCVPGQSQHNNPKPCLEVDLSGGIQKGFAILKDPRGAAQFLLVPTLQISGIESPAVLGGDATNYFADAWEARSFIGAALERTLARDGIGLAINSVVSRSQDQLHIHVACVLPNVLRVLRKNQGSIGTRWTRLDVLLGGHYYMAIWVAGEKLGPNNPFRILAETLPGAAPDMGNRTLVVVGLTRTDGTKGFVILADQVNKGTGDWANGEELLDQTCRIAAVEN